MNEEKETLESYAVNHNNNKLCHPAHDNEQQQRAAAAATAVQQHTAQQQAGIYEYMLVRRSTAYSTIIIIYQVQVLCYETAHGVYVTKREIAIAVTHRAAAAAAAAAAGSLFDCSDDTSIIVHIFTLEQQKGNATQKKRTIILDSNHGRRGQR